MDAASITVDLITGLLDLVDWYKVEDDTGWADDDDKTNDDDDVAKYSILFIGLWTGQMVGVEGILSAVDKWGQWDDELFTIIGFVPRLMVGYNLCKGYSVMILSFILLRTCCCEEVDDDDDVEKYDIVFISAIDAYYRQ